METLLKGVCDKRSFMDLVESFIVFDESSGELRKILARNHQFLGVNRAVEAVRERKARKGRLGVFWHTQGAGKSYSMVMFTRKVHRKLGGNFTFLVLTDRDDLDRQIYKTFAGCGVVDHDRRPPAGAESGPHLGRLLAEHKSHVFSLIQKFQPGCGTGTWILGAGVHRARPTSSSSPTRAHRNPVRHARPQHAQRPCRTRPWIGFTGTPAVSGRDEITRRGPSARTSSTYDFQRAVGGTAPPCRSTTTPRGDDLGVAHRRPETSASRDKLEELGGRGHRTWAQRLERELKRDYHVVTAGRRLDQIARDFVHHYSKAWETGKAMLVCIDKVTCVRMHALIGRCWDERIEALEAERRQTPDEQEAIYLKRRIDWMRETRIAVVVSEEQGEVDKFRKWELDITPHRRLVKEGMELPEPMRNEPRFRNMQRMAIDEAFKAETHPFRIAIVCAMWLTGFDVPSLATLYLDKPLKAHTLMQAIARANRVNEGKNNGLIVDYCGILRHLRKALATFAGARPGGGEGSDEDDSSGFDPARPNEELLADLAEAIALVRTFLDEGGAPLDDVIRRTGFARNAAIVACKEAANENDETRKRFEVMCREVFRKFRACINVRGVNDHRADRSAIDIVYKSLQRDREQADISDVIRRLHEVVDEAIEVRPERQAEETAPYDISRIDFDLLKREFERSAARRTTVQALKDAVEKKLRRLLAENPLRTDFQRHYEEIVAEYNREKDRVTIERTFEALLDLARELEEEESRAVREGLDEESLAVFDLLRKPDLSGSEIRRIKQVAVELLRTLKAEKLRVDQWREKESTRDAVQVAIHDFLWSDETGLPADGYTDDDVAVISDNVFRHVFRAYPEVPSPYYERAEAA